MKNLVKMFVLPIAAFALASAGAVSTNGDRGTKAVDIQGWHRVDENSPCTELRMCNNIGGTLCKLSGVQAYEKTGTDECFQTLNHRN